MNSTPSLSASSFTAELTQAPPIQNVIIAGGTHGNELTGVYLLQYWQQHPHSIQRERLTSRLLLANPRAAARRVRYLDKDLNRCFSATLQPSETAAIYELQRAAQIIAEIGPAAPMPADFVIDLHTTTSNMGISLIIHELSPFYTALVNFIAQQLPDVRVFHEDLPYSESPYLYSMGRAGGLLIEVGPTPQGLVRADVLRKTERALYAALDFLQLSQQANAQQASAQQTGTKQSDTWHAYIPTKLEVFRFLEKRYLPKTVDGQLLGMIHPSLQDRDYQLLQNGDPLFELFTGETIVYQGPDVYPVFINEAAYYDELWGLSLLEKTTL